MGRMVYSRHLQRGVHDLSFLTKKIPLHKQFMHKQVLDKAARSVWNDDVISDKLYLSDASGAVIDDARFKLDQPDGTTRELPWTLDNYLRVSALKYPSRTRLYCVKVLDLQEDDGKLLFKHPVSAFASIYSCSAY